MQLKSVVLPAPFEPSTARRSPGRMVSVMSVSAASAPKRRVTPRSSSALAAPTAERRWATLSMRAPAAPAGRGPSAVPPLLPETDDAVGREEHDGEEAEPDQQAEPVAVETEADQDVEREGLEDGVDERADERAERIADAADDRDDENVDGGCDVDGAGRDLTVAPDEENAADRGDQRRHHI